MSIDLFINSDRNSLTKNFNIVKVRPYIFPGYEIKYMF